MFLLFIASSTSRGMSNSAASMPHSRSVAGIPIDFSSARMCSTARSAACSSDSPETFSPSASATSRSSRGQAGARNARPEGMKIPFATPCGTPCHAVTGVEAACTIAFAFMLNAIPAIVLASISCSSAAGSRVSTALRRLPPIIRIAAMFSAASSGSLPRFTYDSTAWASASAPVAAITCDGAASTRSGSTRAASAPSFRSAKTSLKWTSGSVITATKVTSEPVPHVVGMQTRGGSSFGTLSRPRKRLIGAPLVSSTPVPFAQSIELPPPRPTRTSQPLSRYSAAACDGLGRVSERVQPEDELLVAADDLVRDLRRPRWIVVGDRLEEPAVRLHARPQVAEAPDRGLGAQLHVLSEQCADVDHRLQQIAVARGLGEHEVELDVR